MPSYISGMRVCTDIGIGAGRRAAGAMAAAALLGGASFICGPAWSQDDALALSRADGAAMLEALDGAADHGLPGFAASDLRARLTAGGAQDRAAASELEARVLSYADAQRGGRVDPGAVSTIWALAPEPYDARAAFAAARDGGRVAAWLADLPPADARYDALVAAYAEYRDLAAGADWPVLPDGPALEEGDSGPAVAALRARLAAEGFSCPAEAPGEADMFDASLRCAVEAYQDRRGLAADGVVGPQTRQALNIPAARRVRQIEAGLERWRWGPHEFPPTRVEVNTAAAEAVLYRDGAPALSMRIVAGKPSTPTPTFSATVTGVVLNPPWNVPASIARGELFPKERADPGYLARNHFVQTGGRLVQTPGDHNALGRVKLDMPNPHTVYLHDTSAKALFDTPRRYYSHGCMRMQRPREIAAALLGTQGWSAADVDAAIATGETQTVPLDLPVPVYVMHNTAYVRASDGALILQPDVYGWDGRLLAALGDSAGRHGAMEAAAETECAGALTAGAAG